MPGNGDILVVAAEADVGAVAVADLDGMVAREAERACASEARADLLGGEVSDTAQAGDAAPPEITVK